MDVRDGPASDPEPDPVSKRPAPAPAVPDRAEAALVERAADLRGSLAGRRCPGGDVDDVVQEAVVRALVIGVRGAGGEPACPALPAIAANVVREAHRRVRTAAAHAAAYHAYQAALRLGAITEPD